MGPFTFQKSVSRIFFIDHCTLNSFFTRESLCFYFMNCFFFSIQAQTKTCFSLHITHSVSFTWLALLSHQKFHDRFLFKPETHCLICHQFELPLNKYFCEIKIIFAIFKFSKKCSVYIYGKKS